jgi:hypothetical protein
MSSRLGAHRSSPTLRISLRRTLLWSGWFKLFCDASYKMIETLNAMSYGLSNLVWHNICRLDREWSSKSLWSRLSAVDIFRRWHSNSPPRASSRSRDPNRRTLSITVATASSSTLLLYICLHNYSLLGGSGLARQ